MEAPSLTRFPRSPGFAWGHGRVQWLSGGEEGGGGTKTGSFSSWLEKRTQRSSFFPHLPYSTATLPPCPPGSSKSHTHTHSAGTPVKELTLPPTPLKPHSVCGLTSLVTTLAASFPTGLPPFLFLVSPSRTLAVLRPPSSSSGLFLRLRDLHSTPTD